MPLQKRNDVRPLQAPQPRLRAVLGDHPAPAPARPPPRQHVVHQHRRQRRPVGGDEALRGLGPAVGAWAAAAGGGGGVGGPVGIVPRPAVGRDEVGVMRYEAVRGEDEVPRRVPFRRCRGEVADEDEDGEGRVEDVSVW
ncbi:hypothetical protein GP486_008691, partial [Trichoglossum hirsutum]